MREDEFFINKADQAHLRTLLARDIPNLIEELTITTTRQDRMPHPNQQGKRPKPESRPPVNFDASLVADELHAALVGGVRLMCEYRGIKYAGDPSTLGVCGWLHRNLTALALTEGGDDVRLDILGAVKAAQRMIDSPGLYRYVGPCRGCAGDLYSTDRWATQYPCDGCGVITCRDDQDAAVNAELEVRNYTARELVDIVRDRLGVRITTKVIYGLENRGRAPIEPRGHIPRNGRWEKLYNAGDVFAALREREAS